MLSVIVFLWCLVLFIYYLSIFLSLLIGDFYKTKKEFYLDLIPLFGIYALIKKSLDKLS